MRAEHSSLVDIFQDPLLTILALVLLGTTWLILPGRPRPAEQEDARSAVLRDEIQTLEEKSRILSAQLQAAMEQKDRLERLLAAEGGTSRQEPDRNALRQQIALLENRIQEKLKERTQLEESLRKSAAEVEPPGQPTAADLLGRAKQLRQQNAQLEQQLAQMDAEILAARRAQGMRRAEAEKRSQEIKRLQAERRAKEEVLAGLRERLKSGQHKGGILVREAVETSKSKEAYIMLADNQLLPVDTDHFQVVGRTDVSRGGRVYKAAVITPKPGAKGDDLSTLASPHSKLASFLAEHNPEETRIVMYVDPKSFEMLRRAREIIAEKGFEVSWWPKEDKFFLSGEMPTTFRPPSQLREKK